MPPFWSTQAESRKQATGELPLRRMAANLAQAEALLQPMSYIKKQTDVIKLKNRLQR
jgi:hypothetical protein